MLLKKRLKLKVFSLEWLYPSFLNLKTLKLGLKNMLVPKEIFGSKNLLAKKKFGPKKNLVQKKLGSKKFWGPKKFWLSGVQARFSDHP